MKVLFAVLALFIGLTAFATVEKATIKTSAQCDMCKERLETSLLKVKGIQKVLLNEETKELSVKFDNSLITLAQIEDEIAKIGYWANDKMPDKDAYAALPDCCKPKKSCCANKTSCSKDASSTTATPAKSCCSKEGEKKECSKESTGTKPAGQGGCSHDH